MRIFRPAGAFSIGLVVCILVGAGASQAHGDVRTWVGPNGGAWTNPANWDPAGPIASIDDLVFPAAAPASSVNDHPGWVSITSITFQGSHSISGSTLQIFTAVTVDPSVTVTITSPISLAGLWTIGAGAAVNTGTVSVLGNWTIATGAGATITAGTLVSAGSIQKTGAGTLDLTGANGAFSGAVTIDAGTVIVRDLNGLGDSDDTVAHGTTVNAPGLLDLQGLTSIDEALFLNGAGSLVLTMTAPSLVTLSAPITLTSRSALSADNVVGKTVQVDAAIAGPGALDIRDNTTVRLNAAGNTFPAVHFTGLTASTLESMAADSFPENLAVDLPADATLHVVNSNLLLSSLTGLGTVDVSPVNSIVTVANATTQVFNGTITGAGLLVKTGVGELVLGGANTYSLETRVEQGRLRITHASALGYPGPGISTTRVLGNAVLAIDNVSSPIGEAVNLERTVPGETPTLEILGATPVTITAPLQLNAGAILRGSGGADLTLNDVLLTSTAALIENVTVHLTVSGNQVFEALTIGTGATLHTEIDDALTIVGVPIVLAGNGTLALHGRAITLWGLAGTGTLAMGTNAAVEMRVFTASVFAGAISGSGTITKTANGDWTVSGPTPFTGSVGISSGRLIVGHSQTFASHAITAAFGGSLVYTVPASPTGAISVDGAGQGNGSQALHVQGGDVTFSGPVTFGTAVPDTVRVDAPHTLTFTSPIATDFLTTRGTGTVVLGSNGNALGNLAVGTIQGAGGGTVRATAPAALNPACNLFIGAGATYDLNNLTQTLSAAMFGQGRFAIGSGTLTLQGANGISFSGVFSGTGAIVATLPFFAVTGTHTLTGSLTVNGNFQLDGTLPAAITVNNGTTSLAPNSVAGPLTATGDKSVTIGSYNAITSGSVTLGGLTLSNTNGLVIHVGQNSAPLTVNGPVAIDGAWLSLVPASDLTPTRGVGLTVIDNDSADPIAGQFFQMPEGAYIGSQQGALTLSYVGGTGNDLTIMLPMTSYLLSEGATGPFFDTELVIANPNDTSVTVDLELLPEEGEPKKLPYTLAPLSRTTIRVDDIPGFEHASFSSVVTPTTDVPVLVERTMRWDASGYGAHTEKATAGVDYFWSFAEGSEGTFHTFLLLGNPSATPNIAFVTYMRENAPPIERMYELAPSSRRTIVAAEDADLVNQSFGIDVMFAKPGVAERAMYYGDDPIWMGGHESAGAPTLSKTWFLAEGATGGIFDTFILVANPWDEPFEVTFTFFPEAGVPVTAQRTLPAFSRITINPAAEGLAVPEGPVATKIEATGPVVAERSQVLVDRRQSLDRGPQQSGRDRGGDEMGAGRGPYRGTGGLPDLHSAREYRDRTGHGDAAVPGGWRVAGAGLADHRRVR